MGLFGSIFGSSGKFGAELSEAARSGNTEEVKRLLAKSADVNVKDEIGKTALMYASAEGQSGVVEVLIDKGTDVNIKGDNGMTALMYASIRGHSGVVKTLIDKGADMNVKDEIGKTALMYASAEGQSWVVDMLIDKGADENAQESTFQEGMLVNTDREVISLLKGRDSPFLVDHTAITHAFMLTPNTCIPDTEQDNKSIIDQVLSTINPELWPRVLRINNNIPTLWLISNKSNAGDGLELILEALDEVGAGDQSSVYIGTPTISLDGGQTPVSVYIGFAFKDSTPKIIVSAVECKPVSSSEINDAGKQEKQQKKKPSTERETAPAQIVQSRWTPYCPKCRRKDISSGDTLIEQKRWEAGLCPLCEGKLVDYYQYMKATGRI